MTAGTVIMSSAPLGQGLCSHTHTHARMSAGPTLQYKSSEGEFSFSMSPLTVFQAASSSFAGKYYSNSLPSINPKHVREVKPFLRGEHIKSALRSGVTPLMSRLLYHMGFGAHAEKACLIRSGPLLPCWLLQPGNQQHTSKILRSGPIKRRMAVR